MKPALLLVFLTLMPLHAVADPSQYIMQCMHFHSTGEELRMEVPSSIWEGDGYILGPTETPQVEVSLSSFNDFAYTAGTNADFTTVNGKSVMVARKEVGSFYVSNGPTISSYEGETAFFSMGRSPTSFFAQVNEDHWELKETELRKDLVLRWELEKLPDDQVLVRFFEVEYDRMTGRELIPGTSLPAGKPIYETYSVRMENVTLDLDQYYTVFLKQSDSVGTPLVSIQVRDVTAD